MALGLAAVVVVGFVVVTWRLDLFEIRSTAGLAMAAR
jgi:hypothetical protein